MGVKEMQRDQNQKVEMDKTKGLLIEKLKTYLPEYNDPALKVEDDGEINIELLGYQLRAKPRIVRLWDVGGVMYYYWKFFTVKEGAEVSVGGFFLGKDSNVYNNQTGASVGSPSMRLGDIQNPYLAKNILAELHNSISESDLLLP